jgi:hypothetical protein
MYIYNFLGKVERFNQQQFTLNTDKYYYFYKLKYNIKLNSERIDADVVSDYIKEYKIKSL